MGRNKLAAEMPAGDYSKDTLAQVVRTYTMWMQAFRWLMNHPILANTTQRVQALADVSICIDSSIIEALGKGLEIYKSKPLLNSVTGEEEQMERAIPPMKNINVR